MRTIHSLLCLLVVLFSCVCLTNAGDFTLQVRQDNQSNNPSTSPTSGASQAQSTNASGSKTDAQSTTNSGRDGSQTASPSGSKTAASTPVSAATTAINGPSETSSSVPEPNKSNPEQLPIEPTITPGLGVAGVVLICTGMVYALIGIKNKWLHIFMSTAYLTSLAVSVLIIYVMNPPITNAIQGAYVVACIVTGLVFGGLSIVFTEITEGLGCLCGGFCLGMWVLVLRPGGLITSTGGKAVMIVGFAIGAFTLTFSHYTRPYALIVSIAFAGATTVVLGVDCFTRAGLKEFWLYLWDLNPDLFPLNTNTYPHTRGIRVEISAVVLVCLMGITSQLGLWRVIKEKRRTRAATRLEEERNLEREEEDVGRRVEEEHDRDRAEWEAVYGDKDAAKIAQQATDSGYVDGDSDGKESPDVSTARLGAARGSTYELTDLGGNRNTLMGRGGNDGQDKPAVTVRVARDLEDSIDPDGIFAPLQFTTLSRWGSFSSSHAADRPMSAPNQGETVLRPQSFVSPNQIPSPAVLSPNVLSPVRLSPVEDEYQGEKFPGGKAAKRRSGLASPPPEIVPLPFKIPSEEQSDEEIDEDRSSVATIAESAGGPVRRHSKKRFSAGGGFKNRISGHSFNRNSGQSGFSSRNSKRMSESSEVLIVPHDDDRASSVAATMNDELSDNGSVREPLSKLPTPTIEKPEDEGMEVDTNLRKVKSQESVAADKLLEPPTDSLRKVKSHDMIVDKESETPEFLSTLGLNINDSRRSTLDLSSTTFPEPPRSSPLLDNSTKESKRTSLTSSTDPKAAAALKLAKSKESSNRNLAQTERLHSSKTPTRMRSVAPSENDDTQSTISLTSQLPNRVSKVVMSYRTNEWAKHLDGAERPELDELQLAEYLEEEDIEPENMEEPVPVNIEELTQTEHTAQLPSLPRVTSLKSGQQPSALERSDSNGSKMSYPQDLQRTGSQSTVNTITNNNLAHSASTANFGARPQLGTSQRGFRSSSTPLLSHTLVESPVEEETEQIQTNRFHSGLPTNTLLSQRDSLIKNRHSSLNLNNQSMYNLTQSMLNLNSPYGFAVADPVQSNIQQHPNDTDSAYRYRLSMLEDEDLPLSERKKIIEQQEAAVAQRSSLTRPLSFQNHSASTPNLLVNAASLQALQNGTLFPAQQPFDSHQPKRDSAGTTSVQREAMLMSFRESVQQDLVKAATPKVHVERRREDMIYKRQEEQAWEQKKRLEGKWRDSMFEERMRRGDMLDLHKEAMRKMQAAANHKTTE